ncbi:MAG: O-antigen polysaccharide polymerase Wzy [Nocardioides sp.]
MSVLVGLLLAGLVLLPHSEDFGLRPLAVLSILVSALCLVLVARSSSGGVWSMPFVCLVVLVVFHLGALPQFLFRHHANQDYIERFIHVPATAMAVWISLLAIVAFACGAGLVGSRANRPDVPRPSEERPARVGLSWVQAVSFVGTVVGLAAIVAWAVFARQEGIGLGSSYADYLAAKGAAPVQLYYDLIGIGLVLASLDHRRWSTRSLYVAFACFGAVGFPLGLRGEVLFPLAAALTMVAVQRRLPRPRAMLVIGLLVLVPISVVSQTRQSEGFDLSHVSYSPLDGLSQLGETLEVVSATVTWHHDLGESYQGGQTYWIPVHDAFVRYVELGTPVPESQNADEMNTQIAHRVGDVGGSIIGEAYHNFTVAGALALLFLWGLGLGWLNERARRDRNWSPIAGLLAFTFLLQVRNSFAQVPTVLVLATMAAVAAAALLLASRAAARLLDRTEAPGSSVRVLFGSIGLRTLVLVLAFVTSLVMARSLGPDGRGLVSLLMSLGVLAASLGGLSAELGFAHHFGRTVENRVRILSAAMYGSLAWGTVVGAATALVALVVWSPPGDRTAAFVFLGAYTALTLSSTWSQRALFLEGEPVRAAVASLVSAVVTLVPVAVLGAIGDLTVARTLVALAAGALVGALLSLLWTRARPRDFRLAEVTRALAVGTRFHLGQVALQLLVRFDIVLLSALAGLASVGVYSVAVSLTAPVGAFATTIGTTFLRDQFAVEDARARVATLRLMAVTTLLVVPAMVVITVLALPLLPLVWGPDFAGARWPLVLLAPGVVAMAVQRAVGNYFVRLGRAWILNLRAVVAVLVNVVACLVLIPHFGASGAAVASTVAYLVYAAVSVQYWMRHAQIDASQIVRAFREVGGATVVRLRGRTA